MTKIGKCIEDLLVVVWVARVLRAAVRAATGNGAQSVTVASKVLEGEGPVQVHERVAIVPVCLASANVDAFGATSGSRLDC